MDLSANGTDHGQRVPLRTGHQVETEELHDLRFLRERSIERGMDGFRQGFLLGIADYAHDFAECGVSPVNVDAFANGIFVGEELAGKCLVDDYHGRRRGVVSVSQISSFE